MQQLTQTKSSQNNHPKFLFNLSSHHLQCFISKPQKSKSTGKPTTNLNQHSKPIIQIIHKNQTHKNHHLPNTNLYFDHKVLWTNYGPQDMYIDEELNHTNFYHQTPNNDQQQLEQSQIITQCMRAITQPTTDNTNSQLSNIQAIKFYNQQILFMTRNRSKLNTQQPIYNIKPQQSQFDGRTTLMLRNIPNKYTQQMVLQQVDLAGLSMKYDFFYLPIDFKNDCNVGYAFINLISVEYVQKIFEKFHGKKWTKFNSQKICQVCYARIQGTSQLINHFRFSNSTQRDNRCKPLIYVNINSENKVKDDQNIINHHYGSFTI